MFSPISRLLAASLAPCSAWVACAAPGGCLGSAAVTSFRLSVRPGGNNSPDWIPIREVNNLGSGFRLAYQPIELPPNLGKDAKLALVMIPKARDGQLTVLEPRLAASSTEWTSPFAASIVLVVFAPQGLDEKRLTNLVTRDDNMAAALADYADQTAELESALQLARELEDQADEDASRPPRPMTPADQAVLALVRALNPAVSSYDPLGLGRRAGPATLTGKGMEAFFENAGGLFPGGGALPMVKQWLMPDTEFRSVYAIPAESDGMTLCAQLTPRRGNTKIAYMWAYRLINAAAPPAAIGGETHVPIGMRVEVPLKLEKAADWRLIDHVYDWTLTGAAPQPPIHVAVRGIAEDRALRIDLRNFPGAPGEYSIEGRWDWTAYKVAGAFAVHRFDDLKLAQLTPESRDKLIAGSGPVDVELSGCDFWFIERAALHRPESARQIPLDLPAHPARNLRLEIDTDELHVGPYLLALARIDGATAEIPLRLLPPNPTLERARAHVGDREQTVTFRGTALDRLQSLSSEGADIALAPASGSLEREATVRLHPNVKPGDALALAAKVDGLAGLLRFPGALQIAGARPKILEAKASLPADPPIPPREGEIPAGSWASFAIKIEPAAAQPVLTLECAEPARTVQAARLRAGERQNSAELVSAGGGALFLSLDAGSVGRSGCTLTAVIETEALGKSDPFTLGKVVRLPRIESFALTDERSGDGFIGSLKGFDLETIEKTGWDARTGVAVPDLPRPLAGEGARQSLRIVMPWPAPSPKAPLFIFLRGETEGRATKVTQ